MKASRITYLISLILSIVTSVSSSLGKSPGIVFSFGVVGKNQTYDYGYFVVEGSSVVYADESIRVNYSVKEGFFYIIRKFKSGNYDLVVSAKGKNSEIIKTDWIDLSEGGETEIIYLIGSKKCLKKLEKLCRSLLNKKAVNPISIGGGFADNNNFDFQNEILALSEKSESCSLLGKKDETKISTATIFRLTKSAEFEVWSDRKAVPQFERPEFGTHHYVNEDHISVKVSANNVVIKTVRIIQKETAK